MDPQSDPEPDEELTAEMQLAMTQIAQACATAAVEVYTEMAEGRLPSNAWVMIRALAIVDQPDLAAVWTYVTSPN